MSKGKRITFADIKRQMELASEDIETWPTWMRRAAGLDGEGPDYNTLRAENARLREALEEMAGNLMGSPKRKLMLSDDDFWQTPGEHTLRQWLARVALQPERGRND